MDVCNNPDVLRVIMYIKILLKYVFILVPMGLILMMGLDFFKNVVASKEEDMNKNTKLSLKRLIFCVALFFVPTIVSLIVKIIDDSLEIDTSYISCITNAESSTIEEKEIEYAMNILDDALEDNSYTKIEEALAYANRLKDNETKEQIKEMAENAKNAIIEEAKAKQNEDEAVRVTTTTSNAKYYYYNMDSPDSQSDYTLYVDADENYVSRAVEVTDEEKTMIITTITNEMGSCKAGAVSTAQTIRDTYLYLSALDTTHFGTITGVIKTAFTSQYIYNPKSSEYAEWAYNYVFVQGNSFFPRKFTGQRGFTSNSAEKSLGYYEVFKLKTHYDDNGTGKKVYITDSKYKDGYNLGNSKLDTGGEYADYINPNAKVK